MFSDCPQRPLLVPAADSAKIRRLEIARVKRQHDSERSCARDRLPAVAHWWTYFLRRSLVQTAGWLDRQWLRIPSSLRLLHWSYPPCPGYRRQHSLTLPLAEIPCSPAELLCWPCSWSWTPLRWSHSTPLA